jgi:hypothetical protein
MQLICPDLLLFNNPQFVDIKLIQMFDMELVSPYINPKRFVVF